MNALAPPRHLCGEADVQDDRSLVVPDEPHEIIHRHRRGVQCTVVEALDTVALGMARNNRFELIERVAARGTRIITGASVVSALDTCLELQQAPDGATTTLEIGDFLIVAIGPAADQEASRLCDAAGVPYSVIGDAYKPGDFLSCLRDAWMTALSIDHRFRNERRHQGA